MTAVLGRPPPGRFPFGRRIAAGIRASPGTCSTLPAWWGRDHWINVDVWCAIAGGRDVCREEHVDPHTAIRVARAHAGYADNRTGRDCRPTNERLAAELGMSTRQIQRARAALKRLRLLVEVVRGRSLMSRAERLAAWRRGSSHRHLAGEFALLSIRHPQGCRCSVERVTPPGTTVGGSRTSLDTRFFERQNRARARMSGAARRIHPRKAPPNRSTAARVRAQRLIAGVQADQAWLRGTSPRRLTVLHRFAAQGWTPRDVRLAIADVMRTRGWHRMPDRIERPAAYLAALLRDVDPADRPTALELAMLAEERRRREWIWATSTGRPCDHGVTGGDIPHPVDQHFACLACRAKKRQRETSSTENVPP